MNFNIDGILSSLTMSTSLANLVDTTPIVEMKQQAATAQKTLIDYQQQNQTNNLLNDLGLAIKRR